MTNLTFRRGVFTDFRECQANEIPLSAGKRATRRVVLDDSVGKSGVRGTRERQSGTKTKTGLGRRPSTVGGASTDSITSYGGSSLVGTTRVPLVFPRLPRSREQKKSTAGSRGARLTRDTMVELKKNYNMAVWHRSGAEQQYPCIHTHAHETENEIYRREYTHTRAHIRI